jgi:hypothetical protein
MAQLMRLRSEALFFELPVTLFGSVVLGVLTNHTTEGPWLQEFQPDLQKVLDAKKKHRRRQATRVLKASGGHTTHRPSEACSNDT